MPVELPLQVYGLTRACLRAAAEQTIAAAAGETSVHAAMQLPIASCHRTCLELRCAARDGLQQHSYVNICTKTGAEQRLHLLSHHSARAQAKSGSTVDCGNDRTMSATPASASAHMVNIRRHT